MPSCSVCKEEATSLTMVSVGEGKKKKMCEDCAERAKENAAVAEESEAVVQQMMGFTGRR
ncbi:MAG TPA: hypothetical protein VL400_24465 [Polyangiaceae bacterium]|nr:hypothetical protein [Polyangiaceae bacterium]